MIHLVSFNPLCTISEYLYVPLSLSLYPYAAYLNIYMCSYRASASKDLEWYYLFLYCLAPLGRVPFFSRLFYLYAFTLYDTREMKFAYTDFYVLRYKRMPHFFGNYSYIHATFSQGYTPRHNICNIWTLP
jgi:hypothetical protein